MPQNALPSDPTRGLLGRLGLLALGPLLATLVLVYGLFWRVGEQEAIESARRLAELTLEREEGRFRELFTQIRTQLQTLSADERARAAPTAVASWLRELRPRLAGPIEELYHNDLAGNVLSANGVRFNVADRYYAPAVQRGEVVTTRSIISRDSSEPIVLTLVPVRDRDGRRVGSLGGSVRVTDLFDRIRQLRPLDGFAALHDDAGEFVHGSTAPAHELTALASTTPPDRLKVVGTDYLVQSRRLDPTWTLSLLLPEQRVLASLRSLRDRALWFLALVGVALGLATLGIRRVLARPILRLELEAKRLALEAKVLRPLTEQDLGFALDALRRGLDAESCAIWGPPRDGGRTQLACSPADATPTADEGACAELSQNQGLLQVVRGSPLEPQEDQALQTVAWSVGLYVEREALARQLNRAQRLEGLGRLAGGIAHDLNNMLSVILVTCEMMRAELGDPRAQAYTGWIEQASRRAAGLTQQVLTFARRGQIPPTPVTLAPLIDEVLKEVRERLAAVEVEVDVDPTCPPVLATEVRMHQVLMNLVVNALEAMPATRARLTVALRHTAPMVELSIRDNGCGINEEDLEHLFEPFFTSGKANGTGLGLAVVHGIVTAFGGTIEVDSTPGHGTVFRILMPAGEPAPERDEPAQSLPGQLRCLVVDDEPEVLNLIANVLRGGGCSVVAVGQPARALELLTEDPSAFDVVLSDRSMPDMNGLELAAQVRTLRPDLPVVLVTAVLAEIDPDELDRLNIARVVDKPFRSQELLDVVRATAASPAHG